MGPWSLQQKPCSRHSELQRVSGSPTWRWRVSEESVESLVENQWRESVGGRLRVAHRHGDVLRLQRAHGAVAPGGVGIGRRANDVRLGLRERNAVVDAEAAAALLVVLEGDRAELRLAHLVAPLQRRHVGDSRDLKQLSRPTAVS